MSACLLMKSCCKCVRNRRNLWAVNQRMNPTSNHGPTLLILSSRSGRCCPRIIGIVSLCFQEGKEMTEKVVQRYGQRVGYTETEVERFHEGGHRIRHVSRLSRAAAKYSIQAEVVSSK